MDSIFPKRIMESLVPTEMTIESIAGKFAYFHEELHLLHWRTTSIAEHTALGSLYDYVHDFKDGVIEKIMGYMNGERINVYKIDPLILTSANVVVSDLISFAANLKSYAEANGYNDISNLADSLSGEAAKCRYLLTMS